MTEMERPHATRTTRRRLLLWLLALPLLCCGLLTSCEEEDYHATRLLEGRWVVVEADRYDAPYLEGDEFYFDHGGRLVARINGYRYTGQYTVTRRHGVSTINIWYDDRYDLALTADISRLDGNYTKWLVTDYENDMTYTLRLIYYGY